ncbi:MAG: 3-dehydroquinate synthase [Bacteroidia bacterium]
MKTIRSIGYDVCFESAAFPALNAWLKKSAYSAYFILSDDKVSSACLNVLLKKVKQLKGADVLVIGNGEENKTIETCVNLWNELTDSGADRKALLINLGGGVISDMGGFVASTYKRGIDFINIPTSLLAMADAAVGGKTGIDFGSYKNHIGTFTQPKGVFIYSGFLNSLDQRQLHSGYAEVIKLALVADVSLWKAISTTTKLNEKKLLPLIHKAVTIKNTIVKKDPFEKDQRKALNFGHTVGHALESFYLGKKNSLLHGEAVAVGILAESYLSYKKQGITQQQLQDIINLIFDYFPKVKITEKDFLTIMALMKHDKKNSGGKLNFTLLNKLGKFKTDVACSSLEVLESLTFYNSL